MTEEMVPMLSKDGIPGDVPQSRVADAVRAGFRIGTELVSPDGQAGVVPLERVHDAINAGFSLKPPSVPRPEVAMDAAPSKAGAALNAVAGSLEQQKQGAIGSLKGAGNTVAETARLIQKIPAVG